MELQIVGGPGRYELQIAYFRGCQDVDDIDFKVVDPESGEPYLFQASVWECIHVRGRENWTMKGFVKFPRRSRMTSFSEDWPKEEDGRQLYQASFNTRTRQGKLMIEIVTL